MRLERTFLEQLIEDDEAVVGDVTIFRSAESGRWFAHDDAAHTVSADVAEPHLIIPTLAQRARAKAAAFTTMADALEGVK